MTIEFKLPRLILTMCRRKWWDDISGQDLKSTSLGSALSPTHTNTHNALMTRSAQTNTLYHIILLSTSLTCNSMHLKQQPLFTERSSTFGRADCRVMEHADRDNDGDGWAQAEVETLRGSISNLIDSFLLLLSANPSRQQQMAQSQ